MQNLYRDFAGKHALPLHLQPQWLDAVCGDAGWGACVSFGEGGGLTGMMPYYQTRRFGIKSIVNPPFSNYSGPWINYPNAKNYKLVSRYSFDKSVITDLASMLPKVDFYRVNHGPEVKNNIAWHWLGYQESVRYTYLMSAGQGMDEVRSNYKHTVRTNLNKALESVHIQQTDDAEQLFELINRVFGRKNMKNPYPKEGVLRLFQTLKQNGQATILSAIDRASGEAHSALFLAWDETQMHCILTGQDDRLKHSCSLFLLYDHMIAIAQSQGKTLDLEGSMIPNIEHFFRSLGGVLTPYSVISKASPLLRIGASILGR